MISFTVGQPPRKKAARIFQSSRNSAWFSTCKSAITHVYAYVWKCKYKVIILIRIMKPLCEATCFPGHCVIVRALTSWSPAHPYTLGIFCPTLPDSHLLPHTCPHTHLPTHTRARARNDCLALSLYLFVSHTLCTHTHTHTHSVACE